MPIILEDCVFTGGWKHGCGKLKFRLQIHRLREAEYRRFQIGSQCGTPLSLHTALYALNVNHYANKHYTVSLI